MSMFRNIYKSVGNQIYVESLNPMPGYKWRARITNAFLWDINTFFKQRGELLEYYCLTFHSIDDQPYHKIPCRTLMVPRTMYFSFVDKMFTDRVEFSDEQLEHEYACWVDYDGETPFELYLEVSAVETITNLNYIVIDYAVSAKDAIDKSLGKCRSTKQLKKLLQKGFCANVQIHDSEYMLITINNESWIDEVMEIVKKHCELDCNGYIRVPKKRRVGRLSDEEKG
ncbi:MAG: hypothetical protein FD133_876 [Erysipelotrichaceae bacterium]|nr:MAG: hypothetical protein FD179_774 [Erysipelotrichaceae bacterium]MDP2843390.1 hypothetical protein [Acetobacterium sp.]TXT18380.1 MAG: hypothetical protein FD133_876 [Erysipelotrichaceae bacterium]